MLAILVVLATPTVKQKHKKESFCYKKWVAITF
jgi:hypothetical protein